MTTLADTWGLHPQQFWLHGRTPDQPVRFDETTGMWNVYGYPELQHALTSPATFSSDTTRLLPPDLAEQTSAFSEGNLVRMDAPGHTKYRKLISQAFTPKVVADLEPRIAELTGGLLDEVDGRDRMELVTDLAYPLPVIVIAELLGVPSSDRHLFKQWVDGMFANTQQVSLVESSEQQQNQMREAVEQVRHLTDYLHEHAVERKTKPRDDLLTKLVQAEVDGHSLADAEVVNFANVLLIAGHITTTMLLGNTVLCLDAHPEQQDLVRADRTKIPAAIEESLRFLSPFAAVARATEADVELGGCTIPRDSMVMLWLSAANHDPRQFTDPQTFDLRRDPNPQVGFGRGVHFCLGAPLARLEGRVALNILLDRFPGLRRDPDQAPSFLPSPNMVGVRALPLLT